MYKVSPSLVVRQVCSNSYPTTSALVELFLTKNIRTWNCVENRTDHFGTVEIIFAINLSLQKDQGFSFDSWETGVNLNQSIPLSQFLALIGIVHRCRNWWGRSGHGLTTFMTYYYKAKSRVRRVISSSHPLLVYAIARVIAIGTP